ncbi:kinase-like domain-containing protein [Cladochytrium replicatum]|nr:kinase-like domain-containing protein [Cladochytrium replicatum]
MMTPKRNLPSASGFNSLLVDPELSVKICIRYFSPMGAEHSRGSEDSFSSSLLALHHSNTGVGPLKLALYKIQQVVAILEGKALLPFEFRKRFKFTGLLGDGAFGFVLAAEVRKVELDEENAEEVAIKFIEKTKALQSFNHPNVPKFIDLYEHENYIVMVTELGGTPWDPLSNPKLDVWGIRRGLSMPQRPRRDPNVIDPRSVSPLYVLTEEQEKRLNKETSRELFALMTRFDGFPPEDIIRFIFKQIASAVAHFHHGSWFHERSRWLEYAVKLVDIGVARKTPQTSSECIGYRDYIGGVYQAAPEIHKKERWQGPPQDIW